MIYSEKKYIELEKKYITLKNKYITLENKNNAVELYTYIDWFIIPLYFIYHLAYLCKYYALGELSERKRDEYIENLAFTMVFLWSLYIYKNVFLLLIDFIRYCYNKFNNIIIINLNINNKNI